MITDRYHRHSLIDWFSQDDVKGSSFAVIGCGAVGNEVAKNLALLGVGKIDLFDFDTIELHNLTRSVLFRESDVGLNKAEVAGHRLRELDPNIDVSAYVGDVWELLSLEKAKGYSCILCCVDNFEARLKINQICLLTGTNLINTGIDSKFSLIEVFPFSSGKHVACYECNLPLSAYQRIQQRYSCGWLKKISFIEKKIPTTIITSSLTGALAVANALRLINNDFQHSAKKIFIDSFTGNSTVSEVEQSTVCPSCSNLGDNISVLSGIDKIESELFTTPTKPLSIITSDPILVSHRCVKCVPNEEEATIVFQKASSFNSTITRCSICNTDSVDVKIKDTFTTIELLETYSNKEFPAKFIRFDIENRTIIIELEKANV
ncbi:HesA/MoeB/ThiF family protein [Aeromonas caviae]|uniref:HesA/MoeB/ThiF family protein n=1 Tax=Aeromonas caviae TaxID=648 RepID=UPI002B46737A|nr:ThiF family adenylyltransferase [Aeromonas caviae]